MSYTIAVHVPIAGLSMIPVFSSDMPLLLLPVHIVFLELIIDPACSIVFEMENEEMDIMSRPPRNPKERLFNRNSFTISLFQGLSVLVILLSVFWISGKLGHHNDDSRRAVVFATLVVANLCLILTNRSWTRTILSMFKEPNPSLWWIIGGALAMLALVLNVPVLNKLFHFEALALSDYLLCFGAGILSILWFETLKVLCISKKRKTTS